MQQNNQQIDLYQADEIDLKKLLNSLLERKLFIFSVTVFVTLLAIIYALRITPTYEAVSSFTSPSPSSVININKLKFTDETKESVFSNFLTNISSRELQTEVFLDGDYLTVFNPENNPIDDVNNFILATLGSVELDPPNVSAKELGLLNELPYSISMEGSDAEAITMYLNYLVITANNYTIEKMMGVIRQKVAIRLDEILIERELLLNEAEQDRLSQIKRISEEDAQKIREIKDQIDRARFKAKEDRLNKIVVLADAAKLAKALGIIENNFKLIGNDEFNSKLTIAIGENKDLPSWYLYGEKALLERIELLKTRKSDDPFIPEIVTLKNQLNEVQNNNTLKTLKARQDDSPFVNEIVKLDIEKNKLESFIPVSTGINSMQLSQTAIITPKKQNKKRMIVLLAFIGGFMMSIFLVLVMGALKPDEENSA